MTENIQLVLSNYETRYSDLSVFIDREKSEFYVYMGVALLERISIDAEEIGHKMFTFVCQPDQSNFPIGKKYFS